jgi:threonine dehydrogenase-like Zn-dependent dehydrogenase
VTVVGKHPRKLALLDNLGIRTGVLGEIPVEKRYDIVVDCTGRATGFETALRFVQPRGTLVLKTTVAGEQPLNLAPVVIDELTVVGSRYGPFRPALDALADGTISVRELVDEVRPLAQGVEALHEVRAGGKMKVLLKP